MADGRDINGRPGYGDPPSPQTVIAPDGRLVSVSGDTFEKAGVGGPGWRSPVVLFADPASVGTGIEWTGAAGRDCYAEQVLPYRHNSVIRGRWVTTVVPTDAITLNDEMYLRSLPHRHPEP